MNEPDGSSSKHLSKTNDELNKNGIKNLNINIIPIHNINYSKVKKGQNLVKNDVDKKNQFKHSNNKKGYKYIQEFKTKK